MGWTARLLAVVLTAVVIAIAAATVLVLPRDDVPVEPDAVVVLGGATGERAALGIELADRYDAELVFSSSAALYGAQQGRDCIEDAVCFEPEPANTAGEAENVARMAAERGWDHVTVATSAFHTGRSRYLFRQCLGDERVTVVGTVRPGDRSTSPYLLTRESLGLIAGATVARAC